MKQQQFNRRTPMKFTRFSRKSYALFACLGKEVLVGVLSVSTLANAKADGISTVVSLATDTLSRDELKLDEVVVTGSRAPLTDLQSAKIVAVVTREEISRAAATSVNDILKTVTGVDVRQRGGFGVQTDISVRGGNFDQIAVLLNGVNISSPHTGHLSADFPVSPDDIERIEVLEGPASRTYGANAFNGVVNIITRQKATNTLDANISGGSYGYLNGNASLHYSGSKLASHLSGGYSRSDGATPNSAFQSSRFFWQGSANVGIIRLSAQAGYSYKPYEANTFYGASSTDQWESNERRMAAITADIDAGKVHLTPQIYWNRWHDHYQWHRNNPAGENYHKVDALGGSLSAWTETALGRTSAGVDVRQESIWSTKLGLLQDESKWQKSGGHDAADDIFYKYHDSRTVTSAFLEHNILLRNWTFSFGATAIHTQLSGWGVYPGVDIAWRPTGSLKLFASWNLAMRLPTFTDLYYSGANIEGNSSLKPEKTSDCQIGARKTGRGFIAEAQLFYSHKKDMIDWVTDRVSNDGIFRSVNFRMDNWGGEIRLSLLPKELLSDTFPVKTVSVKYSYINEDSQYDVDVVQSKYAMEYLRHQTSISADGRIWRNLNLSMEWRWQERTGNNKSYGLLDAKISWDEPKWSVYVDGTNLLNKEYYDYVSIRQPGVVVIGGIRLRL
jgi:vitamin B12 transporter